ncbi:MULTISPECIES: hypothetical protein [unclassified Mycolicibacterium]|uniref:hypothetical protein n=1 Tax=unclassified Mycolicibacterium TaxID=2636767 RepID=UPI001F4BFE1B|nr:hypothetical protein [Mycolicibacterium sp. YH-1]UNB52088.1 hypothetical protein L0M16_30145 [Mycolicibacterium sp. YH-1]
MPSFGLSPRLCASVAACAALLTIGVPSAAAAPATDELGYVDSTARCAEPNTVVEFGSTADSRVAVCKSSEGEYQYRGVRLRDGAKLILSATRSDDGAFIAENNGVEYTVAAKSLIISAGEKVIREEPWIDFHGGGAASAPSTKAAPTTPLPPPLPAEEGGGS